MPCFIPWQRLRKTFRCESSRSTIFTGIWSLQITQLPCPILPTRAHRPTAHRRRGVPGGTQFNQLKAEQPRHVIVSAGDLVGASPLTSALFHDEPTIEVMNAIGLEISALGNHEFDRGIAHLLRLANGGCQSQAAANHQTCAGVDGQFAGARFTLLAANVLSPGE